MFQQIDGDRGSWHAAMLALLATSILSAALASAWTTPVEMPAALLAASVTVLFAFGGATLAARLAAGSWKAPLYFALAAVWFTPVFAAAREGYFWSIFAAGAFAASLARSLARCAANPNDESNDPWRVRPTNHLAAIFLLFTGMATLLQNALLACASAAIACFLVAWTSRPDPRPIRLLTLDAAFRIAIAIAACTLLWTPQEMRSAAKKKEGTGQLPPDEDTHSGVILLSEPRARPPLKAPPPRHARAHPRSLQRSPDLIPFTGEYWFYHSPLSRPPRNSLIRKGSPLTYVFTNVERRALSMVATQQLQQELDTSCCARIDLVVQNADTEPDKIWIELILIHAVPGSRALRWSLGSQALTGSALRFDLPATAPFPMFDEIRVVFHLSGTRRYRSASVAIEGFALIPR
ncbi:MAG: hypothetical protein U0R19_00960 [Bryobacteraceae bacterium]